MNRKIHSANKRARLRALSTMVILVGLAVAGGILLSNSPVEIFTVGSICVGLALTTATIVEASNGVRSLIRVDLLLFWAVYGLTFLEFLFPQPDVENAVSPTAAVNGTYAVLVGFAGLAVGRHFVPIRANSLGKSAFLDLRPANVFSLFILVALLGYLHIFLAVNFDPLEAIRQMALPRFSQSWSRGQYGDASALLYEVGALITLIPPIAGLIFARAREYSVGQKVVVAIVLAFTVYYGIASGTRSVFVTYLLTFGGIYCITKPGLTLRKMMVFGGAMFVLMLVVSSIMLEFRNVGLANFSSTAESSRSFFIDLNIVNISRLTEKFPDLYDYLGLEVPFNALIRPIPRVLWPGKPEGLSVPIEVALGSSGGMTLSCTYIGEAYMAGGFVAVLIISLLFGAVGEMWNRLGASSAGQFTQLLYVSGFLCAAIAMRSMLSMMPLLLPTLALWIFGKLWLSRSKSQQTTSAYHQSKQ